MNEIGSGGIHLELALNIAAPPATVFSFFTDREKFARWLGPGATIDPVPGGRFRVPYPGGQVAAGEVLEIQELERVLLSWGYEGDGQALPVGSTTIAVTFSETETGTLLTFRQQGFVDGASRDGHLSGWTYYLSVLSAAAAEDAARAGLEAAVDAYVDAWRENDAGVRGALLSRAFEEDGAFRDKGVSLDGRDALNGYIENSLAAMAGFTLRRSSGIDYCHGAFRYSWEIADPENTVVFAGQSFGDLGAGGRISRIFGFWNS